MTDEELEAIESRANAATAGPWSDERGSIYSVGASDWVADGGDELGAQFGSADAAFVVGARDDIPALIREVRRLRGARDA